MAGTSGESLYGLLRRSTVGGRYRVSYWHRQDSICVGVWECIGGLLVGHGSFFLDSPTVFPYSPRLKGGFWP